MKFRKKHVEIEAVQLTRESVEEVRIFLGDQFSGFLFEFDDDPDYVCLHIRTLEGVMRADPKDWIIKGVNGEFYPCKPDIFEKTYEKI